MFFVSRGVFKVAPTSLAKVEDRLGLVGVCAADEEDGTALPAVPGPPLVLVLSPVVPSAATAAA